MLMLWISQPTVVIHYQTWNFLGCCTYIFALLYKTKAVILAYEIKFQFNCTNLYISKHIIYLFKKFWIKVLYIALYTILENCWCITATSLFFCQCWVMSWTNKTKFCFCGTKLFCCTKLPLSIFVTTWLIVVF